MPTRLTVVLLSLLLATPALIFWIWLVIVPARVSRQCPVECSCDPAGHYITCDVTALNAVPLIRHIDVRVLDIYGFNITLFKNDSFYSLTELEMLNASWIGLRTIQLGTFNGLTKLRVLSLEGNEICEIIPGTFEDMNSLEYLFLRHNELENLDSDVFSGLVNLKLINLNANQLQYIHPNTFLRLQNLQNLYLSYNYGLHIPTDSPFIKSHSLSLLDISGCNIISVSVETFANVSSLEWLKLGYNELENLHRDVFSGLVNLKLINLNANQLQYIHSDTFLGLPNLQNLYLSKNYGLHIPTDSQFINSHSLSLLDISGCNIISVSVETFANVSALELLDLSENDLKTVDINILRALPKLSALYLYGNPLQCDCQLQEVWRWCEDRNIRTAYRISNKVIVPQCCTPTEVEGMGWGFLEKAQCLEGNVSYHGDYNNTSHTYTDIKKDAYENEYDVKFFKQYQVPVFVVPFIFGTTGNIILLIIIICNRDMRTVPNMYIINLALSDIICLAVIFSEGFANSLSGRWLKGQFLCTFLPFCRRFSVGLSAYSVAVLSVQRYRVTVNPFQVLVSSQATWRVTVATVCGVWIVAALLAVPSALSKYLCEGFLFSSSITYYQLVVIFEHLVSCAIPLGFVAFSYIMTALHLLKSSRSISEGIENPKLQTRRYTAKIVVGLTVVFVVSYVPYHAFWTYFIFTKGEVIISEDFKDILSNSNKELQYTYLISTCFLLINSCLNPVALFCTSSPFRQHLKRYLTCYCKTNSPPNDIALRKRN